MMTLTRVFGIFAGLLHANYRMPSLDYQGVFQVTVTLTRDHE